MLCPVLASDSTLNGLIAINTGPASGENSPQEFLAFYQAWEGVCSPMYVYMHPSRSNRVFRSSTTDSSDMSSSNTAEYQALQSPKSCGNSGVRSAPKSSRPLCRSASMAISKVGKQGNKCVQSNLCVGRLVVFARRLPEENTENNAGRSFQCSSNNVSEPSK
jgi:hypothetical protein